MLIKHKRPFLYKPPHSNSITLDVNVIVEMDEQEYNKINHEHNEIMNITEQDVIELHKEFKSLTDFEAKVRFGIERIQNIVSATFMLSNGNTINFLTNPQTPDEFFTYNTLHIEYYKKTDYRCSIEGRIEEFNKKIEKVPIKQKFIENELNIIKEFISRFAYHKSIGDIAYNNDWDIKIKNYYNDTINGNEIDLYKNITLIYFYLIGQSLALYEKFLLDEKLKLKNKAEPKNNKKAVEREPFIFRCSLSPDQLKKLHISLRDGCFIAPKTKPEAFISVFHADATKNTIEPIKWIDEPVLLAYFIDKLRTKKFISNYKIWVTAKNRFTNSDNLKQLCDGYQNSKTGKPKRADEIDIIFQ